MLPHAGFGEADAHVTLSTGIMSVVDRVPRRRRRDRVAAVRESRARTPGAVWRRARATCSPKTAASSRRYSVQAMIRGFARDPNALGLDATNAM